MIFFDSFSQLGYSAWNIAVAFFFLGAMGAAMLRIYKRPAWFKIGYPVVVFGGFVAAIIVMAPLIDEVQRANADWEARRDADPRVKMQKLQR